MAAAETPSRCGQVADADARALTDRVQQGRLAAGDAQRRQLAPQLAVQLQQHGPQSICHIDSIQTR